MSIKSYFEKENGKLYDVVVAADVLSYIGELTEIFQKAIKSLRAKGLFVFTIEGQEHGKNQKSFGIKKSGRFGYSTEYIDKLVTNLGDNVRIVLSREYSPRLDAGEPVAGYIYILEKS